MHTAASRSLLRSAVAAIASCAALQGCVPVQEVSYYQPAVDDPAAATLPWGYGLALAAKDLCVHVADGSRHGERFLEGSTARASDFMNLVVWLVPERQNTGLAISPDGIAVRFDDGTLAKPAAVRVNRYRTKWDVRKSYLLRQDAEETIYFAEPTKAIAVAGAGAVEPLELWDLTRVIVTFIKPARSSVPRSVSITGIAREGEAVAVAGIRLSPQTTLASLSSNVPLDYKGCRALQASLGAVNRDRELAAAGMGSQAALLPRGPASLKAGMGVAAGSITYSVQGAYRLLYRRLDGGGSSEVAVGVLGDPAGLVPALMRKGDFQHAAGELFAMELPPGDYEIYSWAMGSRCGVLSATSPFSLVFRVTPGNTVYLGSIEFSGLCTSGYLDRFSATYRNRAERDLPLLKEKYPALKEARIGVPPDAGLSVEKLGSATRPETRTLAPSGE